MPDPTSSEALLHQATAGDTSAVDILLQRHLPGLQAYVRLRVGRKIRAKESASDLVQSVCREVIEHADRFQHGGEVGFRHWLYKTALRKIANRQEYYEAAKRDVHREVATPTDISEADAELLRCYASFYTPSQDAAAREGIRRVEAAFDELPEQFREVIVLSKIVGLSRAEVAEEMGRTEAAVGNLLYRALVDLSEMLDRADDSLR